MCLFDAPRFSNELGTPSRHVCRISYVTYSIRIGVWASFVLACPKRRWHRRPRGFDPVAPERWGRRAEMGREEATMKRQVKARAERKQREIQRGVTLDASGDQLMARIAQRIQWHKKQATTVDAQLKRLVAETATDTREIHGWRRHSTITELGKRLREHEERGQFLTFVRQHLSGRTIYRLDSSDLRMLEIMPESVYWW
jgi:hypothetical protein